MNKKNTTLSIFFILLGLVLSTSIHAQEPTEEADDEVQQRVEERLEQAGKRLKAFIGTVTDRTEDTMQLENDMNEIKLISVGENATFAETNGTSEDIEFDDIGIGDYVISMGTIDENNVLSARRIVVTSVPEEITRESHVAVISTVEDDIIIETKPENISLTLDFSSSTSITQLDDEGEIISIRSTSLDRGDKIIIIGSIDEDVFEADRIHIIEQAPEPEGE